MRKPILPSNRGMSQAGELWQLIVYVKKEKKVNKVVLINICLCVLVIFVVPINFIGFLSRVIDSKGSIYPGT